MLRRLQTSCTCFFSFSSLSPFSSSELGSHFASLPSHSRWNHLPNGKVNNYDEHVSVYTQYTSWKIVDHSIRAQFQHSSCWGILCKGTFMISNCNEREVFSSSLQATKSTASCTACVQRVEKKCQTCPETARMWEKSSSRVLGDAHDWDSLPQREMSTYIP